jgi:FKBP12-rapamycin complex-associated protein
LEQIIARIHTPRAAIQSLIIRLLHDVGRAHPLTVAAKSTVQARKAMATSITNKMREHSAVIVDQVCPARSAAVWSR